MRWAMLVSVLISAAWLVSADLAYAMAVVSLDPAPDGTLTLVGSGWRPGQRLIISLGSDAFLAQADATGSFEVPTGLLTTSGPPAPMTIRRPDANSLAFAHLGPPPELDVPSPFALLFAEGLAMGARLLAISAGGLGLATLAVRAVRAQQRSRWP